MGYLSLLEAFRNLGLSTLAFTLIQTEAKIRGIDVGSREIVGRSVNWLLPGFLYLETIPLAHPGARCAQAGEQTVPLPQPYQRSERLVEQPSQQDKSRANSVTPCKFFEDMGVQMGDGAMSSRRKSYEETEEVVKKEVVVSRDRKTPLADSETQTGGRQRGTLPEDGNEVWETPVEVIHLVASRDHSTHIASSDEDFLARNARNAKLRDRKASTAGTDDRYFAQSVLRTNYSDRKTSTEGLGPNHSDRKTSTGGLGPNYSDRKTSTGGLGPNYSDRKTSTGGLGPNHSDRKTSTGGLGEDTPPRQNGRRAKWQDRKASVMAETGENLEKSMEDYVEETPVDTIKIVNDPLKRPSRKFSPPPPTTLPTFVVHQPNQANAVTPYPTYPVVASGHFTQSMWPYPQVIQPQVIQPPQTTIIMPQAMPYTMPSPFVPYQMQSPFMPYQMPQFPSSSCCHGCGCSTQTCTRMYDGCGFSGSCGSTRKCMHGLGRGCGVHGDCCGFPSHASGGCYNEQMCGTIQLPPAPEPSPPPPPPPPPQPRPVFTQAIQTEEIKPPVNAADTQTEAIPSVMAETQTDPEEKKKKHVRGDFAQTDPEPTKSLETTGVQTDALPETPPQPPPPPPAPPFSPPPPPPPQPQPPRRRLLSTVSTYSEKLRLHENDSVYEPNNNIKKEGIMKRKGGSTPSPHSTRTTEDNLSLFSVTSDAAPTTTRPFSPSTTPEVNPTAVQFTPSTTGPDSSSTAEKVNPSTTQELNPSTSPQYNPSTTQQNNSDSTQQNNPYSTQQANAKVAPEKKKGFKWAFWRK